MAIGTFDEAEYERREAKIAAVDADSDDRRTTFEGRIEDKSDASVDELLERLRELKSKR